MAKIPVRIVTLADRIAGGLGHRSLGRYGELTLESTFPAKTISGGVVPMLIDEYSAAIEDAYTITSQTDFFAGGWTNFVSGDGAITNHGDGSFTADVTASGRAWRSLSGVQVVAGHHYDLTVDVSASSGDVAQPATLTANVSATETTVPTPSQATYFSLTGSFTQSYVATATGSVAMRVGLGAAATINAAASVTITAVNLEDVTYGRRGRVNGVSVGDSIAETGYFNEHIMQRDVMLNITKKGISGSTLQSIQTRFQSDALNGDAQFVIIEGGINNIQLAGSDPNAAMQSAMTSMITATQAIGKTPIVLNVSPFKTAVNWSAGRQVYLDTYNTWLAGYVAANSILNVDVYTLLEDPGAADTLLAAYGSGDGLHWGVLGHRVVGNAIFDLL